MGIEEKLYVALHACGVLSNLAKSRTCNALAAQGYLNFEESYRKNLPVETYRVSDQYADLEPREVVHACDVLGLLKKH